MRWDRRRRSSTDFKVAMMESRRERIDVNVRTSLLAAIRSSQLIRILTWSHGVRLLLDVLVI